MSLFESIATATRMQKQSYCDFFLPLSGYCRCTYVLKYLTNAQTRVLPGTGTDETLTPGNLTDSGIANSTISSNIPLDADTILEGLQ
jgi:hypothetical protein